jgi:hypothetical protein
MRKNAVVNYSFHNLGYEVEVGNRTIACEILVRERIFL